MFDPIAYTTNIKTESVAHVVVVVLDNRWSLKGRSTVVIKQL